MVSKEETHPLQKFTPSILTALSAVAFILSGKQIIYWQTAQFFVTKAAGNKVICSKTIL